MITPDAYPHVIFYLCPMPHFHHCPFCGINTFIIQPDLRNVITGNVTTSGCMVIRGKRQSARE